ncbi:hypothetical protein KIP88_02400 [Bradyrhizobium sp. SRL28]|uniref:hypothetical protein n=1 Tax=Bradyrhizobium sp. SRL28 TaxID=2836178 RepID=UPI001BDECC98|nr:hypothetical protein [Bradyrhizobium sp. SRL28]MBT1509340.1 hypothetical protein [Bradyrhizobium sp. SRL28]
MTTRQLAIRSLLTVGLPFILIWAFVAELWRELRSAFRHAWLEVRANLEAYHREMQRDDY